MKASTLPTLLSALGRAESSSVPDAELLDHFTTGGDQSAFTQLVHRYARLVWRVARTRCRTEATAEDVFQATFVVLAKKAGSIRSAGALAGWLHRTAHRLAVKATRAETRPKPEQTRPKETDPLDALSARELLATVDDELAKLTDAERSVLILCGVDGEPLDDVATRLGCSATVVKGRLQRARAKLRTRLEARGLTLPAVLVGLFAAPSISTIQAAISAAATSTYSLSVSSLIAEGFNMKVMMMKAALTLALCGMVVTLGGWTGNTNPSPNATAAPLPKEEPGDGQFVISSFEPEKAIQIYSTDGKQIRSMDVPGQVRFGKLAPDGKRLAYLNIADVNVQSLLGGGIPMNLCWVDAESKKPTPEVIAEKITMTHFVWSPDGQVLYYSHLDRKKAEEQIKPGEQMKFQTWMHNFKTCKTIELNLPADHKLVDITRDGKTLLTCSVRFEAKSYTICLTPLDTLKPQAILKEETSSQCAKFSPDGKQLLMSRPVAAEKNQKLLAHDLFILDLSTLKERPVPLPKEVDTTHHFEVCWSPDGTRIAISWLENLAQPRGSSVKRGPVDVTYAKRVTVCNIDGSNPKTVIRKSSYESMTGFDWAPLRLPKEKAQVDRQISAPLPKAKPPEGVIVLSSFGEKKKIELFKPDGESLKVFEPKGSVINARLTPDGKRIAYFDFNAKAGALKGGWAVFDFCWFDAEADGLEVQKIAENVAGSVSYAWSTDGQTVYYSHLDPEKYDESAKPGQLMQYRSYAFNFKTKKATELKLPGEQMILDITPDGKSLLTSSQCNRAPTRSLSLTPLDTCKPQLLLKDETSSTDTRYSPDGKQLLLSRVGLVAKAEKDKGPGVYLLDLTTKKEHKIRLPDEMKDSIQFNACFSPDGKRMAIHWSADIPQPGVAPIPAGPPPIAGARWTASRVTVCDIDGGNAKTVISREYNETVMSIDWAPVRLPEEKEQADRNISAPLPKQGKRESMLLMSSFNKDKPLEVIKPDGTRVKTIKSEEWFKPLQVELSKDGKRAIFQNMAPVVARKVPFTMQSLGWMDLTAEKPEPKWIAEELYYITKAMSADGGTVFYSHIDLEKLGNGPTKGESLPFESWQYDIAKDKKTRLDLPSEHAVIGITPDGKNLLTSTTNHGSYKHSLYLIPRDTMKPEAIREKPFSSVYSPRFSPDGSKLLWICIAEDKAEEVEAGVVITDLKSKKDSHVPLPKHTCVMHVCWSPDGQEIGFAIQQVEKKGNGPAMLSEQRVAVCDFDGTNLNVIQKRAPGDDVMGLDWGIANSAAEDKPSREPINAPLPKPKFEWKEGKGIQFKPSPYGDRITGLAHSPDGKFIAVAVGEQVHLLDATTQKPVNEHALTAKAPGTITSVAFSPKGDKLAMTAKDFVFLYSELGKSPSVLSDSSWKMDGFDAHQVAFSTDKDDNFCIAATNGEETAIRIEKGNTSTDWMIAGGVKAKHQPGPFVFVPRTSLLLRFATDKEAMDPKPELQLCDIVDGTKSKWLKGHKARPVSAVVSADGKRIISADEGGTLIVWESEKDEFKETSRIELGEGVAQLALAPDGKTVAAVRAYSDTELMGTSGRKLTNLELHLFDVTDPPLKSKPLWSMRNVLGEKKAGGPFSLVFSPDGKKLLAAFADPYIVDKDASSMGIKVWELVQQK